MEMEPIRLETHRSRREHARLHRENDTLRRLVMSMALGLDPDEMPADESAVLTEILEEK